MKLFVIQKRYIFTKQTIYCIELLKIIKYICLFNNYYIPLQYIILFDIKSDLK